MYEIKKIKHVDESTHAQLDLNSIKIDSVAIFDIFIKKSDDFVIIVKAGTIVSEKIYNSLKKQTAIYISKESKESTSFNYNNLETFIQKNRKNYKNSLELMYNVNTKMFEDFLEDQHNKIDTLCVRTIIRCVILLVAKDQHYLKNTIEHFTSEHLLANHSLHVAIHAINLGHMLKYDYNKLEHLGTAGILHDLGLKKIDDSIKNKHEKLTPTEHKIIQKHPLYSVEMIKQNLISNPYILNGVMYHHENYDGSGYPNGLNREEISDFASILSISDVFDALTSNRADREKMSTFEALNLMLKDETMINKFNRSYIKLFLKSLSSSS